MATEEETGGDSPRPIHKRRKVEDDEESSDSELSVDSYGYYDYDGYTSNEYDKDAIAIENEDAESQVLEETSGGIISKLPVEVFLEILSRVPIKSISSCRWVSKSWYNAIKNPRFIKMHHDRVIQNKSFCVLSYDSLDGEFSLLNHQDLESFVNTTVYYSPKLPKPLFEMDSCNGLICSRIQPYFVCNPITGEHMVIPKPPMYGAEDVVTGFGFDAVSQGFKFVRVIHGRENFGKSAEVYNFRIGKWRLIPEVRYCFDCTGSNAFVNGALHWLGYPDDKSTDCEIIISFRLDSEEFQQLPLPHPPMAPAPISSSLRHLTWSQRGYKQNLSVLGESLCTIRTFREEEIEIWLMKDYGVQSSWVKEYNIEDIMSYDTYMDGELEKGPYKPLQLMKNGKLLMLCEGHDLGYYDAYDGFSCIYTGAGTYFDSVLHPLLHIGSLISPRSIGKLAKSKRLDASEEDDEECVDEEEDEDGYMDTFNADYHYNVEGNTVGTELSN